MPLEYDDMDGSWGPLSDEWPAIQFRDDGTVGRVHPWLHRDFELRHGTYVLVLAEIRFETVQIRDGIYKQLLHRGFSTRDLYKRG